ncbi:MAG: phosphoribosylglycinamide formyltransferase [Syntrophomonadaceae bacterium]|nr:phosphoribosylglycinamide formyltransferase [Syntrophomonadaceae bacterium]
MQPVTPAKRLRLAVLASGRGSNFLAIQGAIENGRLDADICLLISDQALAPALERARELGIKALFIDPKAFPGRDAYESELVCHLQGEEIDFLVLAGYMRLVGGVILNAYSHRVLNIHHALLPSFLGLHAQRLSVEYRVKYSGCTVHVVDSGMDTGPIIKQAVVPVEDDDTEDSLAERILAQEHRLYWQVLQLLAEGRVYIEGRKVHIV